MYKDGELVLFVKKSEAAYKQVANAGFGNLRNQTHFSH